MTITYSQTIPHPEDQPTLSIEEAGRLAYGMTRAQAYRAAKEGYLPTVKISERRYRVPTAALRRLLGLDVQSEAG